jgi:NAD(P)-dependent dehydrogenase (short-subunit alcohol dehydrogenase family)
LEVNLIGPVAVTQAFLPLIRKARGRIVNIGSIGGRISTPVLGPYSASKYAIEAITDALRVELRPWGINVAVIEPGSIATPIWEKGQGSADQLEAGLTPEAQAMYAGTIAAIREAARQAERRGIPPDAVAKAVAHALASKRPKTRYLVGFDARLQAALATIVPDRLLDRLIVSQVKLPKTAPDVAATRGAPIEQSVR